MVARLVHSTDFERLRATRAWARSEHFAVHHLPTRPFERRASDDRPAPDNLSTGADDKSDRSVDKSPDERWLGCVLPKRLARRAVTRNLLRRQIRAAMARHEGELAPGLWVVRLRAPFARTDYPSAASQALRLAVRGELDALLASGAARAAARARST